LPYLDYEEQNKSIITLTKIFKGNSGKFGGASGTTHQTDKNPKNKNNFCSRISQQQEKIQKFRVERMNTMIDENSTMNTILVHCSFGCPTNRKDCRLQFSIDLDMLHEMGLSVWLAFKRIKLT